VTPLRVVQWGTGNIGARSLQAVIEHPALELVGVFVYADDKVGRDAGELCGLEPTGVAATGRRDEVVALGADVALYMPRSLDPDDVVALLESGTNVVTTRGEFHRPESLDPALRDRIDAACREGGSSIHSTGSSPGFITEAIPLVLTSIQRRLDRLTIDEYADMSSRHSPELIFDIMGFGRPPESFDQRRVGHLRDAFGPSLQLVAEALGATVDRVEAHGEVAAATAPIEIAAGTVEAGTIAAMRTTVSAVVQGRELLRFRANWYCGTEIDADWSLQSTGWRVNVEGDTPLDVTLHFPVPLDRMAETTPGYTAHRAVNAVFAVGDAGPGIRTSTELPQIIAKLGEERST
jgi:4-hydroxy-tetrahydrodipicolinate reductase